MKKKIVIIMCLCMLSFGGCSFKSGTDEEDKIMQYADQKGEKFKDEEKEVLPYDELVQHIDFHEQHIEFEIKDKLSVDADISTDIPTELGTYRYEKAKTLYEEEQVINLIDEYYGEDVTLTLSEDEASHNISVSEGFIRYCSLEDQEYFRFSHWAQYFPFFESDYDKDMIDGAVSGFVEHFKEILPKDIEMNYRCVHFNEEFWARVEDKYSPMAVLDIEDTDFDYYMVRMDMMIEQDVMLEEDVNLSFTKGDEISWQEGFFGESDKLTSMSRGSYVDLLIDETGQVFAFSINNDINVTDCVEVVEILTAREILEKVYDEYADKKVYEETIIRSVRLKYVICLDSYGDENGYRGAHLEPVWSVKFTRKNESYHRTIMYSAVTGNILYIER